MYRFDCRAQTFMSHVEQPTHFITFNHWVVDDWKHFAWFDEFCFQLYLADGRVREWRQSMDPTCQQGSVQSGGTFVME